MIELGYKHIKIAILNILHMFKKIEESLSMMRKETKDVKISNSNCKVIKNKLDRIDSRLDTPKGKK